MTITEKAYAKINLYLHINGKRDDGYHDLESMVAFADIYDVIKCEPADTFTFKCDGSFSSEFSEVDLRSDRESSNLVVRASYLLADRLGKELTCDVTLTKNIPMQAGLGGGSADAAAALRALCRLWNVDMQETLLSDVASYKGLGADVPVCVHSHPCYMTGIGEQISKSITLPEFSFVIVFPQLSCSTATMFSELRDYKSKTEGFDKAFPELSDLTEFLDGQTNSFEGVAVEMQPRIGRLIEDLKSLPDCLMARLTGSGSACFAIFETHDQAAHASEIIKEIYPSFWVRAAPNLSAS